MPPFDETTGTSSVPESTTVVAGTSADTSSSTSPPENTNADTQAPASPGDTSATSPSAPVDDRAGLLEVIQKVVKADPKNPAGEGKSTAPDGSSTTETKPDPQAVAAALEADPTEEEFKGMTPRTKARVEKLLEQRHAARQEVEALKPHAAKWQQMEGYLRRHDLAAEDANTLLGVGASLRRGDFKAFLDGVMPYVEHARQALGQSLPPDLRQKVDAGEMTEEAAKQLGVARITNARLQTEVKANTDAAAAQRAAEAQARTASAINAAVVTWEQGIKSRDPDYAKMAPEVEAEAALLIAAHGQVKTVEEATAIAERAYARVKRLYAAGRPAPVATPKQPSGARAVNGARPEPKTLMEAAMMAVERSRA